MNSNNKNNKDVNIFNKTAKNYSSYIFDKTIKYQKKYGFQMGTGEHATWNNEADAFKHAFMQAQLALLGGKHLAKQLGDKHERDGNSKMGQSKDEFNMDNWNNAQGREIAKELIHEYGIKVTAAFNPDVCDLIAEKVYQKMKAGKLITHPNDPRRYVPKNKSGNTTGQAAPISNSDNLSSDTQPSTKPEPPKTTSQKISDAIRTQYYSKMEKNNQLLKKIFGNHFTQTGSGQGRWVTINGTHVFIED